MTGAIMMLIGVVALFAAIVGGGVKVKEIEVGTVQSIWRQILLGVFGLAVGLIGLAMILNEKSGGGSATAADKPGAAALSAAAPATAPVQEAAGPHEQAREVYFHNGCNEPVTLSIAYNREGKWVTAGEWEFAADEGSVLDDDGTTVTASSDDIYLYAKSKSGSEWSGNTAVGEFKNLTKAGVDVDNLGRFAIDLTCE